LAINFDVPGPAVAVTNASPEAMGAALGPGRWFLLPSLDGQPLRPPRPLAVPSGNEAQATAPEDRFRAAGAGRTRAVRAKAYAAIFRHGVGDSHILALERAIDALTAHGASPSALDQVLAPEQVLALSVRLLLKADVSDLSDRLDLERHGTRRWAFVAPWDWGAAVAEEPASLTASLVCSRAGFSARSPSAGSGRVRPRSSPRR
jgi:hypothetical protein